MHASLQSLEPNILLDHSIDTPRDRLFAPVRAVQFALENALGRRLVAWMVFWSLLLALASTSIQLWVNYRRDVSDVEQHLNEVERSSVAGIAFEIRNGTLEQVRAGLVDLLSISDIAYASVTDRAGHELASAGAPVKDSVTRMISIVAPDTPAHAGGEVARLTLQASLERTYMDIGVDAVLILGCQFCEILLVCAMMMMVFRRVISKPLSVLARAAARTDVDHLGDVIRLRRPPHASDDFDTLVDALNSMRAKLKREIDVQASYRDELELRVAQRTSDLDAKIDELQVQREEQALLFEKLQTARQQAVHSEKMASIGQLAAGVAHEINNPVGFVLSNFNSLGRYLEDVFEVVAAYEAAESLLPAGHACVAAVRQAKDKADLEFVKSDIQQLLSESCDGLDRVRRIVGDLKEFSHSGPKQWQRADLLRGLESTLNVVRNEIKYKAEIVKRYGTTPEIDCLPSELNQVFMNLLVNASHAITERGTITLTTGATDEEVWIEIADTGSGIPAELLNRIFDPFFTTKPVGQGTGLGLSLSYSIVRRHGGRIEVDSVVGAGTTFRVWLPIRQASETPQEEVA